MTFFKVKISMQTQGVISHKVKYSDWKANLQRGSKKDITILLNTIIENDLHIFSHLILPKAFWVLSPFTNKDAEKYYP